MNPALMDIHQSWHEVILSELYKEPLATLNRLLPNISYQPSQENIFRAFQMPLKDVKVVILGQDPYPTPGDAIGYAFAANERRKTPKSLKIIAGEIEKEGLKTGFYDSDIGHWQTLEYWTKQGVLLLNTALTVQTASAGSHLKYWQNFTAKIISHISIHQPCIWIFWGKKAKFFIPCLQRDPFHVKGYDRVTIEEILIDDDYNYILTAPHPAAELYTNGNGGFYGCDHFYLTNRILTKKGLPEIIW